VLKNWLLVLCRSGVGFQKACRKRPMMTDKAATRSLNGVRGKEWRNRWTMSAADSASVSAKASAMARAASVSDRPLSVAGTMVTSPNGLGG
jgi:hypothetical protein